MQNEVVQPVNQTPLEERLRYRLGLVNEWLKFAEAKNGALVAGNSLVVAAVLDWLLGEDHSIPPVITAFSIVLVSCFVLAALVALYSFLPQLKVSWNGQKQELDDSSGLIFFGDIAKYDAEGYLRALYKRSNLNPVELDPYELDYAKQLVTNSCITHRKYQLFKIAVIITALGLVVTIPIGLYILIQKAA